MCRKISQKKFTWLHNTFLSTLRLLGKTDTLRTRITDRGKLKTIKTDANKDLHFVDINPTIGRRRSSQ